MYGTCGCFLSVSLFFESRALLIFLPLKSGICTILVVCVYRIGIVWKEVKALS